MKADCILDTSALIAFFLREPGHVKVAAVLENEACAVHAVNVAEFCFTLSRKSPSRYEPKQARMLLDDVFIDQVDLVDPLFLELTAHIRLAAPALSVGDGFAVALASTLDIPVLTADKAFEQAGDFARVELIR